MENRGNRTSEELAQAKAKLYGFSSSSRPTRNAPDEALDSGPFIRIGFEDELDEFQPGDFLRCEYSVTLAPEDRVQAVEASVIWLTEGKGDTDIGVHFFERRQKQALSNDTFRHPQRISAVLPACPLSYEGNILKIRWCVRVRLFLPEGKQVTKDQYFQLGQVHRFSQSALDQSSIEQDDASATDESGDATDSGAA